jgi:hypothetical protein
MTIPPNAVTNIMQDDLRSMEARHSSLSKKADKMTTGAGFCLKENNMQLADNEDDAT